MKVIWFDIGSTIGWAHNASGTLEIAYGQWDFTAAKSNRADRLCRTLNALDECLRGLMVDVVGFERPFCRGRSATRSLWGQAAMVEAMAQRHGFPVVDEEPKSIKKFITGNGNAKKEQIIEAVELKTGFLGLREHEADAIAGLYYALNYIQRDYKPQSLMTRKEKGK